MPKERTHGLKRDAKRAAIIKDTADLVGVSPRLVNMVLNTERENETVVSVFMGLSEKYDEVLEEFRNDMPNWTTIFNPSPKTL